MWDVRCVRDSGASEATEENPENQFGSITGLSFSGSATVIIDSGLMCENSVIKLGDRPLLIKYLIAINLSKPSLVKCSLLIIILYAFLNNL